MSATTDSMAMTSTTFDVTEADDTLSDSLMQLYIYGLFGVSMVSVIMAFTLCIFLCQYAYDYIKRKRDDAASSSSLFTTGFIYFIVSILELLLFAFNGTITIALRFPAAISVALSTIEFILYLSQYFILLLISLLRLRFVFTDSVHQVNPYMLKLFFGILLLLLLACGPVLYLLIVGSELFSLSAFVAYIACLIIYSVAITVLYLLKLHQCHRQSTQRSGRVRKFSEAQEEDSLLQVVRRNAILVTVSVTMTVAQLILLLFAVRTHNIIWNLFFQIAWMSDVYTNAVSVMLSYSRFDAHYRILCGCMDRAVQYCLNGGRGKQAKVELQEPVSRSRVSVNISQQQRTTPAPLPTLAPRARQEPVRTGPVVPEWLADVEKIAADTRPSSRLPVMSATPDTHTPVSNFGDVKMPTFDLQTADETHDTPLSTKL